MIPSYVCFDSQPGSFDTLFRLRPESFEEPVIFQTNDRE